jgi:glycerol-3-phosphate dehydrogenase subunit C
MRKLMDSQLGVHPDAWMPELATQRFRWGAAMQPLVHRWSPTASARRARWRSSRPAIVNYNEPGIGHDLLKVLDHNEIPYVIVDKEKCCGMPKLELGDLEAVERHKEANIPVLARYAKEGYAIVTAVPSCTLMFKQELPLMFPDCADTQLVKEAMFDPFEYLVARHKDGLLKTDFKTALGKVSYHIPCHGRVQNIGKKTEEMLKLIGTKVEVKLNTVERCSGHAGTYGVKTPTHPISMKIGKPVFKAMAKDEPDYIGSDCPMAGHHIAQGMAQAGHPGQGGAAPAEPGAHRLRTGVNPGVPHHDHHPRQPDDAGGLLEGPQDAQARGHRPPPAAQRGAGRARDAAVRGRADDPLPDPGDAAHREDLRRGGHPTARSRPTRRWCPTAATGRRRC